MSKILVVIDMQNDFITGELKNENAEKIIPNIVKKIESGIYSTVIATKDIHGIDYLSTPEGMKLPIPHCLAETEGSLIQRDILNALIKYEKNFRIVQKGTFGSFELVDIIDTICKNTNYDDNEIELCGTVSSICVVSNAILLKTMLPNIKITVDAQAISGMQKEDYLASILIMKYCQIDIINEVE